MPKSESTDSDVARKQQGRKILRALKKKYPVAECSLTHDNSFQLLVAVILSAQCTDARVNMVVPKLFDKFPTPEALAGASQKQVEKIIHSLGFFRAKATNLRGMAKALVEEHDGEVPQTLDELTALPGVGRKTANVVLGNAFDIPSGFVVDTHVKRISRLLGLTKKTNPDQIERDLTRLLPKSSWIETPHRLIFLGREICIARRPQCAECPLLKCCDRTGLPPLN
ncbi:endonuclease III [Symmachiella dynata]|uniref:endonuclease III n=1 Tax=Symmachiella dynata TaxID=2527995 RepID=UPI0030ED1B52